VTQSKGHPPPQLGTGWWRYKTQKVPIGPPALHLIVRLGTSTAYEEGDVNRLQTAMDLVRFQFLK
jgi:hypothetical protein